MEGEMEGARERVCLCLVWSEARKGGFIPPPIP